jgi:hypothetical protein
MEIIPSCWLACLLGVLFEQFDAHRDLDTCLGSDPKPLGCSPIAGEPARGNVSPLPGGRRRQGSHGGHDRRLALFHPQGLHALGGLDAFWS